MMNQSQGGNCAYYDNSYSAYQSPATGQYCYDGYNRNSYQNAAPAQSYNDYGAYQDYTSKPINYETNYSMNNNQISYQPTPCMGRCNPPKLYADTYNYLTENLMKPVIEEVYHDLKSITSTNTVANNAMAAKMGLVQGQAQSGQNTAPNAGQSHPQSQVQPVQSGLNQSYQTNQGSNQINYPKGQMMQQTTPTKQIASGQVNPATTQMTLSQNRVISHNARQMGTIPQNAQTAAPLSTQRPQGRTHQHAYPTARNGIV